ncbi:MAG: hypothetical protein V3V31_09435 [Methylococcales bacterium]
MIGKSGQNGLSRSRFSILGQSPSTPYLVQKSPSLYIKITAKVLGKLQRLANEVGSGFRAIFAL